MRLWFKNNWIVLLILILSLGYIFFVTNKFIVNMEKSENRTIEMIRDCKENMNTSSDDRFIEYCSTLINEKILKVDFFTMMSDLLIFSLHFFNGIAFLMLIIPFLFLVCKIMKRKHIIYALQRESYTLFLKKFFLKAYKYIWLLPLIALILILISAFHTTFDISFALKYGTSMWEEGIMNSPIIFIACYLLNIFLSSCFFLNLALVVARKHHNFISSVLLSFILYVGIELFFEIVINMILCQMILKIEVGGLFNIMNLFIFSDSFGIFPLLLFTTSLFFISILLVYFSFKDKERFIIDCEKNSK